MNILDEDCPRIIQMLALLKANSKVGLITRRIWKSKYEVYLTLKSNAGRTHIIVNEFISAGILAEVENGYYFDSNRAREYYRDTQYADLGKRLGLSDIFG